MRDYLAIQEHGHENQTLKAAASRPATQKAKTLQLLST